MKVLLILLFLIPSIVFADANEDMFKAAKNGDIEMFKSALDDGADVNDDSGFELKTALGYASGGGHIEIVKLLLDNGADVNVKNKDGTTALMAASYEGRLEIVKLLLDNGADVNAVDGEGNNALDLSDDEEIIKLLKQYGAK
jgi:serine/threonine-protein phosphatase 6 regulatory ankyrin repeat subunit B